MRVSLSWLKELVEVTEPVDELAQRLSMAGFEEEEIDDLAALAQGVVVGYVKEREKHPNADKLSVCQVDVGGSEPIQIVCGAKNVRAGIHVPVAMVGAVLPAVKLTIKAGELRGVASNGMICSLSELGLANDSDGIAVLEELESALPEPGQPVAPVLGLDDTVLDLAITANRPDGLSMVGIAREVAALTGAGLSLPALDLRPQHEPLQTTSVSADAMASGGLYGISLISGVDGGVASPAWVQRRLSRAGINRVNAVVDITNVVMLEQGQPLHAFDADALERITGKPVEAGNFGLRQARDGERFTGLDDRELTLDSRAQLVTCHDHPIALAGVMGSKESGVSATTTRIWLESAMFSPVSVRTTARSVGLRTDASARFEKGLPKDITLACAVRALELLQGEFSCELKGRWACGQLESDATPVGLRRSALHRLLGPLVSDNGSTALPDAEIERCLTALGCQLTPSADGWAVTAPPARRLDLAREIDLIEEVARLVGFDRFGARLPHPVAPGSLTAQQQAERQLRRLFSAAGLQEITTLSLVGADEADERIAISNPLLAETSHLRTNLWEEHLAVCLRNLKASQDGCWVFEIGTTYSGSATDVTETRQLCGVMSGERRMECWTSSGKPVPLDYFAARGRLAEVMQALKLELSDRRLENDPRLHPGRAATLVLEGRPLGCFGQLHPELAAEKDLPETTYLFELDLQRLLDAATRSNRWTPAFKPFATVPASERDLAVVVDGSIASSDLTQCIRKAGKPLLEAVTLIDRFEGEQVGEGMASQAFRLRYRGKSETLTEEQVAPVHDKIRKALVKQFSADLRS